MSEFTPPNHPLAVSDPDSFIPPEAAQAQPSAIYFIQAGYLGPIKIGRTSDLEARRGELQVASPVRLIVLYSYRIPDAEREERALHTKFRRYRPDELITHIASLLEDGGPRFALRPIWRGTVRDLSAQIGRPKWMVWSRFKRWEVSGLAWKLDGKRWEVDFEALKGRRFRMARKYCQILREARALPKPTKTISGTGDRVACPTGRTVTLEEMAGEIGKSQATARRRLDDMVVAGKAAKGGVGEWVILDQVASSDAGASTPGQEADPSG